MSNYKDTMNVPIAISDNTALNLDCKHITTANWMQLNPIYTREMVPGEKIELGIESFTRLNPLVVPTFAPGSKLKVSRFFVPFRTVFKGWNDFIVDSVHVPSDGDDKAVGIPQRVPVVKNNILLEAMTTPFTEHSSSPMGYGTTFAVSAGTSGDTAGFDYMTEDGTKYTYTVLGRQAFKVLQSLGYKINPNTQDAQEYSALPLLCYAKVYADYYWPSAYMDSYLHYFLEGLFNQDTGVDFELTAKQTALLLRYTIFVCYDSDYFTSAFDNPVAPSTGNYSQLHLNDYSLPNPFNRVTSSTGATAANVRGIVSNENLNISSNTGATGSTSSQGTPAVYSPSAYYPAFTQYVDTMLHRLTDYMRRNQISSRAAERYMARFGKALDAEKLNRCVYLGTDLTTIQIGDVMSTSDTVDRTGSIGAELGSYAGKGIAYSKNDYDSFSTDEYGMYIVTSSLVPDVFYDQGVDYDVYHIYKTEFWQPEFDYGMRAIQASELLVTNDGTSSYASVSSDGIGKIHDQVFGFTPRYAEYRVPKSKLTGSFRIPTLNGNSEFGSNSWHMMREFKGEAFGNQVSDIVHSPSFVYGVSDGGQYNRIFYNSASTAPDQFVTIYDFNVKSYAPYAPLYDNYDWCEEQSGRKVSMPVNGVKVN